MISTNFCPNDPVPPVMTTTCSDQFIKTTSAILVPSSLDSDVTAQIAQDQNRRGRRNPRLSRCLGSLVSIANRLRSGLPRVSPAAQALFPSTNRRQTLDNRQHG